MKKRAHLALVALMSVGFLVSCTNAQTTRSVDPALASSAGITVIIIKDEIDDDDQTQQIPRIYRFPTPETIAEAQEEIRSNDRIRAVLVSKSIQLRNVVGVQTAYNGGKIVYVR